MKAPRRAEVLRAIPEQAASLVRGVLKEADARRLAVYLVGGPVRDLLLGREVTDVDLVVTAREGAGAADLARAAATADLRITAHDRFGTVSLRRGEVAVDLATVRRETYSHDGALPTVAAGTLEEDLRRRDFTVNALALPLSDTARSRHAGVVDFDEGIADLEQRRLRVLHPRSFHDDPTRALRAARLAPRLGFTLSRGSRSALRDALRDGAFGRVSGDRLRREIVKLFDDSVRGLDPSRALRLLSEWHVLGALEPGLTLEREGVAPLRRLGRSIETPPWRCGRWRPWVSGLALWLAPAPPNLRRRVLQRFSVRGEAATRIGAFAKARAGWLRALERARGRGAIDAVLRQFDEEDLHALFATATPALRRRIVRYAAEDRSRRAPVTGDDLMAIGLEGPAVGRALARIREAYLDGAVNDRDEALTLAQELLRRRGAAKSKRARREAPRARG
jgi:tRNA nucleotidyltransferase (CCA-adding enzyme)